MAEAEEQVETVRIRAKSGVSGAAKFAHQIKKERWVETVNNARTVELDRHLRSLRDNHRMRLIHTNDFEEECRNELKRLQEDARRHYREKLVFDIEYGSFTPHRKESRNLDQDLEREITKRLTEAKARRRATVCAKEWARIARDSPAINDTIFAIRRRQMHERRAARVATLNAIEKRRSSNKSLGPNSITRKGSTDTGSPFTNVSKSSAGSHKRSQHSISGHSLIKKLSEVEVDTSKLPVEDDAFLVYDLLDEFEARQRVRDVKRKYHPNESLTSVLNCSFSMASFKTIFTPSILQSQRATEARLKEISNYPPLHVRKDVIRKRMDEIMRPLATEKKKKNRFISLDDLPHHK